MHKGSALKVYAWYYQPYVSHDKIRADDDDD